MRIRESGGNCFLSYQLKSCANPLVLTEIGLHFGAEIRQKCHMLVPYRKFAFLLSKSGSHALKLLVMDIIHKDSFIAVNVVILYETGHVII